MEIKINNKNQRFLSSFSFQQWIKSNKTLSQATDARVAQKNYNNYWVHLRIK